jgi:bacillithiol biosynthesis deacetylase BshB1
MKLDMLVIAAHPDDAELGCGGTIARHVALGYQVGIVDLTRGELGTRGTPSDRESEATAAAAILKLSVRENLDLPDGFLESSRAHLEPVIRAIRRYQPQIVITNAPRDRHPDHGRAAALVTHACFLAGLPKVTFDGDSRPAWRPEKIFHFIQSAYLQPDFVVDISDFWETKMASIRAFKTQFHNPDSAEPATFISTPAFLKLIEARATEHGHAIGAKYGEGFIKHQQLGVTSLFDFFRGEWR